MKERGYDSGAAGIYPNPLPALMVHLPAYSMPLPADLTRLTQPGFTIEEGGSDLVQQQCTVHRHWAFCISRMLAQLLQIAPRNIIYGVLQ